MYYFPNAHCTSEDTKDEVPRISFEKQPSQQQIVYKVFRHRILVVMRSPYGMWNRDQRAKYIVDYDCTPQILYVLSFDSLTECSRSRTTEGILEGNTDRHQRNTLTEYALSYKLFSSYTFPKVYICSIPITIFKISTNDQYM